MVGGPAHGLDPVEVEALFIVDIDLSGLDGEDLAVAVGDEEGAFLVGEAGDVADGEAQGHMTLVVGLPVFHEVADLFDVDAGAGDLPEPGMRWLAARTRLSFVALQELY